MPTNWRFNPFNQEQKPVVLREYHRIKLFPEMPPSMSGENFYGIRVNEGIFQKDREYISIKEVTNSNRNQPAFGKTFREVNRGINPNPDEYRVDYDAPPPELDDEGNLRENESVNLNTGLIEFNSADNDILVEVNYEGTGTLVKDGLALEPIGSFRWHFPYRNALV